MSIGYYFVNHDKEQYFDAGLFAYSRRLDAVTQGPGARALILLLERVGSWRDDRISVIGDIFPEFDDVRQRYTDVTVEVELMMLDIDGFEWVERGSEFVKLSGECFLKLACIAIYLRRQDVADYLDEKVGKNQWQKQFEEEMRQNSWNPTPQRVIDAGNRALKIW